ncbi:MAG: septum formation initiator family protein [Pseudomonadales bacterium]|nr:septum formation initiator family protein [Pseudomonadales bacterium]
MRFLNIFLLALFAVMQYRLWLGEGSVADIIVSKEKIEQQQAINSIMTERNALLSAEVISLHDGHEGIEEYARTELGLIKPGETFYLVVQ